MIGMRKFKFLIILLFSLFSIACVSIPKTDSNLESDFYNGVWMGRNLKDLSGPNEKQAIYITHFVNDRVYMQNLYVFFDTPARDSLGDYFWDYKVKFVNDTVFVGQDDTGEYLPEYILLKNKKLKLYYSDEDFELLYEKITFKNRSKLDRHIINPDYLTELIK